MRYFNGEIDPVESVICLLNICDNLDSNANFDNPAIALESVAQKCLQVLLDKLFKMLVYPFVNQICWAVLA